MLLIFIQRYVARILFSLNKQPKICSFIRFRNSDFRENLDHSQFNALCSFVGQVSNAHRLNYFLFSLVV